MPHGTLFATENHCSKMNRTSEAPEFTQEVFPRDKVPYLQIPPTRNGMRSTALDLKTICPPEEVLLLTSRCTVPFTFWVHYPFSCSTVRKHSLKKSEQNGPVGEYPSRAIYSLLVACRGEFVAADAAGRIGVLRLDRRSVYPLFPYSEANPIR
jgi:hypothetical protein